MRDRDRKAPFDRSEPFGEIADDPLKEKGRARVAAPVSARQAPADEFLVGDLGDQGRRSWIEGWKLGYARGVTGLGRRDSMPEC